MTMATLSARGFPSLKTPVPLRRAKHPYSSFPRAPYLFYTETVKTMRFSFVLTALSALSFLSVQAEKELPVIHKEDFSKDASAWKTTDDSKWKLTTVDGNQVYELLGVSRYRPPFRSPHSIALLKDKIVGSFVLTARIQTTQTSRGHRDLCFFFNYQDPAHFYYLHLGEKPDPNSSQIFIVNQAARKNLILTKEGIPWKNGQFHDLKIVRDIETGKIDVYFDDMEKPVKSAVDKTFTWGQVGIGSFDDKGYFDDIVLRGVEIKKGKPEGLHPKK